MTTSCLKKTTFVCRWHNKQNGTGKINEAFGETLNLNDNLFFMSVENKNAGWLGPKYDTYYIYTSFFCTCTILFRMKCFILNPSCKIKRMLT